MLALAVPMIAQYEGKSNDPYKDIAGVMTVCYGETRVKMKRYTDKECTDMLAEATGEFGKGVVKVNPSLSNYPYQWAAATSLAYNIGLGNYAKSTVAKRFNAGDYYGACSAFASWNKVRKNGRLVESQGLTNRRQKEMRICYQGF